jgi:hypothetical protein
MANRGYKTRKFGGETFKWTGFIGNKTDAKKEAARERSKGSLARVVDTDIGYLVYVKEKMYRAHHGKPLRTAAGRKIRITR